MSNPPLTPIPDPTEEDTLIELWTAFQLARDQWFTQEKDANDE